MNPPFAIELDAPLLTARFDAPQRMVSWALHNGGFADSNAVAWLEVKNADLPLGRDPVELLQRHLEERGLTRAVGLMTSRSIARYHLAEGKSGPVRAWALMTLGLSNALHVASPVVPAFPVGTINLLCHLSCPLSDRALLEASAIATQARTAALLEAHYVPPGQNLPASGTGTDCVVMSSPPAKDGETAEIYAGLHTDAGRAVGRAVHQVTAEALKQWLSEKGLAPISPANGTTTAALVSEDGAG